MTSSVVTAGPVADLASLSARELAALVRVGRVCARDVLQAHLQRAVPGPVPHVTPLDARRATATAAGLDARLRHGLLGGELAGVPVLVGGGPQTGLETVGRLRHAGAVVLGRSGAAAAASAVASGLVPLALTEGSAPEVHATARRHGLVGLVPATTDATTDGATDGGAGVLARDVRDTALTLGVLRGRPVPRAGVAGLRVTVLGGAPGHLDEPWAQSLLACGAILAEPAADRPSDGTDLWLAPSSVRSSGACAGTTSVSLPSGVTLFAHPAHEPQLLAAAALAHHA